MHYSKLIALAAVALPLLAQQLLGQPPGRRGGPPLNPKEAAPGTIRGDLAIETTENLVHGSDSPESAQREIALFFPELADGGGAG